MLSDCLVECFRRPARQSQFADEVLARTTALLAIRPDAYLFPYLYQSLSSAASPPPPEGGTQAYLGAALDDEPYPN